MTLSGEVNQLAEMADVEMEKKWLRGARRQDAAAWEQLVRRYEQPVFRLAYLLLGDADEAEEVAQDVFVKAFLSLAQFDDKRPFRPWLLQITRNVARNRRRSIGRYWAALKRWRQQQPEPIVATTHGERAAAALLWQAVRQLKPAWQEVIYLRYFLALSEAETAAALNVAVGTVKSRHHRALAALKQKIEPEFVERMK